MNFVMGDFGGWLDDLKAGMNNLTNQLKTEAGKALKDPKIQQQLVQGAVNLINKPKPKPKPAAAPTPAPVPAPIFSSAPQSNTLLYVGIGTSVVALAAIAFMLMRRRNQAVSMAPAAIPVASNPRRRK